MKLTLEQSLRMLSTQSLETTVCEAELYTQEMQELNQAYIQNAKQAIQKNAQDDMEKMLKIHRKLRKTIAGMHKTPKECLAYECGIFIGSYTIIEEMHSALLTKAEQQKCKGLLDRKHVQDILHYLYQNPDARQGKIAEDVNISPNYLSEILNLLLNAGYVTRYGKNKGTRYCLTKTGRFHCNPHKVPIEQPKDYIDVEYQEIFDKEQFWKERAKDHKRMNFKEEFIYEKRRIDCKPDPTIEQVVRRTVERDFIGYVISSLPRK